MFYYTTCVLKSNNSSLVLKRFSGKAVFSNTYIICDDKITKLIKTLRI